MGILKIITDAQIASAVIYPTSPYTGPLPEKTVRKGSEGSDVKAVQKFLNWCIKAGLKVDSSCGKNTVSAIKKYQKQYKLKVDGVFGSQSKKKAKSIIAKYAPKPTPVPKPVPVQTTIWDDAYSYAKSIASDDKFKYVKYSDKNPDSKTCPICKKRVVRESGKWVIKKAKAIGWNCIGGAFAAWHHGAGIKCKCNCHVFNNSEYERMLYKMNSSEALKFAKEKLGNDNIKLIRNKNGIPKSEWKQGDIGIKFKGKTYVHTWFRVADGKVFDCRGLKDTAKQIAIRSDENYTCKMIIRYTGK